MMSSVYDVFDSSFKKNYSIHKDYLSYVFPLFSPTDSKNDIDKAIIRTINEVLDLLHLRHDEVILLENKHFNGYEYCYQLGECFALRFGGRSTRMLVKTIDELGNISKEYVQSVQFEATGQGCREVENLGASYIEIINYFKITKQGKSKRKDIAIDDFRGDFDMFSKIMKCIKNKWYTSKFRREPIHRGNDETGHTYYFGSNSSPIQLCIYDKKKEREAKNDPYSNDYWVRYELRFRDDKADALDSFLYNRQCEDIGEYAKRFLFDVIQFKEENNFDKNNQYKSSTAKWWTDFIEDIREIELDTTSNGHSINIEKNVAWHNYAVSGITTKMLMSGFYDKDEEYMVSSLKMLIAHLRYAKKRLEDEKFVKRNIGAINTFRKNNNLEIFTLQSAHAYANEIDKQIEELENIVVKYLKKDV